MRSTISAYIPSIMLFSNSVWTVYGIKTTGDEVIEMRSLPQLEDRSSTSQPSLVTDASSWPTPTPASDIFTNETYVPAEISNHTIATTPSSVPAAPSVSPLSSTSTVISPAVIAAVCLGIILAIVLFAFAVLKILVCKRRRRERALRRAVEEVMSSGSSMGSLELGLQGKDVRVGVEEKTKEEVEGGRLGMSLPRRTW
ncbi:hypothetical protein E8E13_009480 [Curvularia kusanoi]|uniref:Uncharacterized protein n=1 Tax=Curvularia kusanoi TaxID=90978 RepID=A0A9P4TLD1_CURKU|nr:hypothetical protein E8E13_009480 [Curvularia kusanoi]